MPFAFVNSTAATIATAASTWSIPTHSSRVSGAGYVIGIGPASSAVTVVSIADNVGTAYALAVRRNTPRPAAGAELWYGTNVSSNSTRISITLSGVSSGSLGIGQWTGFSTQNALLQTGSSAITANSTSHGAQEITPSGANALVVSFARLTASSIGTVTNLGGMTTWLSTAAAVRTHGMYLIQAAPSTASGSFTTSSNCQHAAVIAAFSDTTVIAPPLKRRQSRMSMMGYG